MGFSGMLVLAVTLPVLVTSQGLFDDNPLLSLANLRPGNINEQVDALMGNFSGLIPDKLDLGTLHQNFARDCSLTGLATLRREGDITLEIPDETAAIKAGFFLGPLTVNCNYLVPILFVNVRGAVAARVPFVTTRSKITVKILPGEAPDLEEFRVVRLGRVFVQLSDRSILGHIGSKIINHKLVVFRDVIVGQIERFISERIKSLLQSFALPSL